MTQEQLALMVAFNKWKVTREGESGVNLKDSIIAEIGEEYVEIVVQLMFAAFLGGVVAEANAAKRGQEAENG